LEDGIRMFNKRHNNMNLGRKQRLLTFLIIIVITLLSIVGDAAAATGSGYREIVNMGCVLGNTTCYVYVSGGSVGPVNCNSTSIRWDEKNSPGGKNALAMLTSAFMAGKTINFAITDTCYGSYPTFSYFNIAK
jgi:hypothetical protein